MSQWTNLRTLARVTRNDVLRSLREDNVLTSDLARDPLTGEWVQLATGYPYPS